MFDPRSITDWLNLTPKILFGVFLGSSILLVTPSRFLSSVRLDTLPEVLGTWLGVVWLVSLCMLAAHGGSHAAGSVRRLFAERMALKAGKKRLANLSSDERRFLSRYFELNTRTRMGSPWDGTIAELQRYGIVEQATVISDGRTRFPYNIAPWAWDYLQAHRELLEDSEDGTNG